MAKERKHRASSTRSTTKKTPARRSRSVSKKNTLKKDLMIFGTVIVMVAMVVLGYFIGKSEAAIEPNPNTLLLKSASDNKVLFESLEKVKQERALKEKKREEELAQKRKAKQQEEREKAALQAQKREEQKKIIEKKQGLSYPEDVVHYEETISASKSEKPKLVIIIDDVSSRSQLEQIRALGLKLTPSIFPPYSLSPSNQKLAEGLKHYMIHLPMESGKVFDKQEKTLMVTDTPEMIEARVRELRSLFPAARFVNNHTGSVFTGHYPAMERLYQALLKEGFVFVDSRTIAGSKVPQIAKKYAQHYISRDIFIDNKHNVSYIHKQLKQAVKIAQKRGYAIAIGHPHEVTLQALASAGEILKEIEIVYIDELYPPKAGR
ncbi:MAG: divergent polysaccharide deacetylase family protein [Campylobacterales bacterium]|nr:divergent polysaccharide deacetylase family protein [Campylobacterales bacterium]HEO99056.1 divergent polysaccharide deacetylase family protein [Campylobacterota bacterium]